MGLLRAGATIALGILTALLYTPVRAVSQDTAGQKLAPADRAASPDTPPAGCRVTLPAEVRFTPPSPLPADPELEPLSWGAPSPHGDRRFWFGTEKLWTILPVDGTWRHWADSAYAYVNKLPWFAVAKDAGPLTITGKRLDGQALSFTEFEEINGFGRTSTGVEEVMGGIAVPVSGCWQVTGRFRSQELSFTVWVPPVPEKKLSSENNPAPSVGSNPTTGRLYVAGEVEAKNLRYWLAPEIPPTAKSAKGGDKVVLHAVIGGNDGVPRELQYVSGPELLAKAAMDAVQWWRYEVDGTTDIDTTIDVVFPPPEPNAARADPPY
jgi:hypothetical protein